MHRTYARCLKLGNCEGNRVGIWELSVHFAKLSISNISLKSKVCQSYICKRKISFSLPYLKYLSFIQFIIQVHVLLGHLWIPSNPLHLTQVSYTGNINKYTRWDFLCADIFWGLRIIFFLLLFPFFD